MIRFSNEVRFNEYNEYKIDKDRLKHLEDILRILGNFDEQKDIIVTKYERATNTKALLTYLYEVEDQDYTSFKFYNYDLGTNEVLNNGDNSRYRKNYYLIMKRKDDTFTYKYDFSENQCTGYKLRVIEVSYPLTDNRVIKLTRSDYFDNEIIIEENGKSYRIGYRTPSTNNPEEYGRLREEKDKYLLENFEMIIEKAKDLDTLNVENVLTIIDNPKNTSFCNIEKDNELLASINFSENGEIYRYQIVEPERKIEVWITDKIKRTVERQGYEPYTRIIDDDFGIIQNEGKRLFKYL